MLFSQLKRFTARRIQLQLIRDLSPLTSKVRNSGLCVGRAEQWTATLQRTIHL